MINVRTRERGLEVDRSMESLARDEATAEEARTIVWQALKRPNGHRMAYSALCRWTWRAMIERRLDTELRGWHRLLLDTAARMAERQEDGKPGRGRARVGTRAAAQR